MDITRGAIEKTRVTVFALLVVLIAGLGAYRTMSRAEDPGFTVRAAVVTTLFPGASPERIENLVTDKLEKGIQEVTELAYVTSISQTGLSIITVVIEQEYQNMRPIWDDLRRQVEKARSELPAGIIGPIVNDEFGDVFGIVVALTGDGFSYSELKDIADQVRDELLRVPDVAKVDIYGTQEERVFVEYNNARLAELGLSPLQLRQILESTNIIIPGGTISTGVERIVLEPSGNFEALEDLGRTVVTLPGREGLVFLEDLADVRRGYIDPPLSKMQASGFPSLGLAISMREEGNVIRLGTDVDALLDRLEAQYPLGLSFETVASQPEVVNRKIQEFVVSLSQAILIVLLVLLAFLGIRTGLIVASLVPMAIIMSLMVMAFFDMSLNQMSLASLIIALGMLVDNAIVMAESIMVQVSEGKKRVDAAVGSARELRAPLLVSSLTTAAAFLPIYLSKSDTGEYTAPLFEVVTITLLGSWLLALTMTPLLCVLFLKVGPAPQHGAYDSGYYRFYLGVLLMGLRRPFLALLGVLVIFGVAMQGFQYVPAIFFPPSDKASFTVDLALPTGSSIGRTEEVVRELDRFVREELAVSVDRTDGITNWATFIGEAAPRFYLAYVPASGRPEYAVAIFNATSRKMITEELIPKMETFCFERFPDLEATMRTLQLGPPIESPIQVRISGREPDEIFDISDRVKAQLRSTVGTKNIHDDWGLRSKKLVVKIDQPRARRSGVTNQDIATSLQTILSGFETTQFREQNEITPVVLRSVAADRQDVGKLESLNVYAQNTGTSVPLLQVADVEIAWEAAKILRRNRMKTVTVSADLVPGVTASEVNGVLIPWLEDEQEGWGLGYSYELGGELESSIQANEAIMAQLPTGGLIILLLLVWQFNSIRRTFIILLTIPLGLIGVVIGLLVVQSYFGFMTLLGIIALAGIVINNAIVLLDRINIEISDNGLEPARAVVEAAQRRFRPILLTTATTIAGLLPLWFGGGPLWEPMATAMIFGLLFATVLTLGVVPVLYAVLFRVRFKDFVY